MTKTTTSSTALCGLIRTFLLLLTGLLGIGTLPAQIVWTGADATSSGNYNWSDNANWSGGIPGPTANILFNDVGDANPNNNTVDISTNILSLWYASTNISYTTTINPGVTLTVSNNAAGNLLVVGTLTDSGSVAVNATITDNGLGGELVVVSTNAGSVMQIQQGSATAGNHNASLDLSGLGTFNLTAGRLLVAGNPAALAGVGASNYLSGTLNLALTNVIHLNGATTPALDVGDDIQNVNSGTPPMLQLGETNALFVDTMTIGRSKTPGTLQFNPSVVDSYCGLYLRGQTATRVSSLAIGDNSATGTGSPTTGLMDLSAGWVDAQVNTCSIALGQNGGATYTGASKGTLNLSAGIFNVNTLNVGTVTSTNANYNVTGTINVYNTATLVVNSSLALGANPNISTTNSTPSIATATLAIGVSGSGGTVYANTITSTAALAGGVSSTLQVENGGTLYLTNTAGTPAQPIGTLNLSGGAFLHLNASPLVTNIVAASVSGDNNGDTAITIDSIVGYLGGTMTYPLITYTNGDAAQDGNDPFPSFSLNPLPAGFTGTLVDNFAANEIDLQITAGIIAPDLGSVVWGGGVNNHWDTTSLNWTNGALTTWYGDTDWVTFNDWGKTNNVVLAATVSPGSVTVSNSVLNYTISGTGDIAGSGGLTKWGTGTLTLGTTNTYTGGTAINGGTLITAVPGALPPAAAVFFTNATPATQGTNILNLQGWAQTLGNLITTNNAVVTNNIVITGTSGSALTVSPATLTLASFVATNFLTVNLFGLSSFTYNNSAGTFQMSVGVTSPVNLIATGNGVQTTVTLAGGSNSITAANLNVGNLSTSGNTPITQLNLGTNNTWNVGAIGLGGARTGDLVQFASGVSNGVLKIAGVTGGGSLAAFTTASHDSFQAVDKPVDVFDTTAGTLNAQFGAMTVGKAGPVTMAGNRGVSFTSSFKMGAGALNAASLVLGVIPNAAQTNATYYYTWTNAALFSITNGGTASITNLIVASNSYVGNLSTGSVLSATISLTNGATLNATTIQEGGIATPALGTLNVTSQILWGDGTLGNIPGNGLTVTNVSVVLAGTGTNHNVKITSGQSGLISSVISGPGTLTDIGAGPLTLAGTNAFNSLIMAGSSTLTLAAPSTNAGSVTVSSGTLLVEAPLTTSAVTVQTNGILGGATNLSGAVTVQSGGVIQGGDANYANTLNLGSALNLGSISTDTTYSRFTVASHGKVNAFALNVNGTNIIQILDPSLTIGTNTLFTYTSSSIGGTSHFGGFQLGALPPGVTAQLLNPSHTLQLAVTATNSLLIPTLMPAITNFSLQGTNVVIRGTNGQAGYTYYLLTTTNLANPVSHWSTVATNVLGAGNYTFIGTNAAGKLGQQFYRLSSTNYNH